MEKARVGVIGGSGVYDVEELKVLEEVSVSTPFGRPSDRIVIGNFGAKENVAFLPRHGRGHRFLPTEVNSRANIWALKSIGVVSIIGISAVGSLKEEVRPGDIVIPDQIIDRTRSRVNSFFGEGIVGHVPFADPFCPELRKTLIGATEKLKFPLHSKGTYVCMEGPPFSTRAESNLYRSWGADLIGMTVLPEAKMAREAEICYATIALPTDYDCWRESTESVSADMVMRRMQENIKKAKSIIRSAVENLPGPDSCACRSAARFAFMTDRKCMPKKTLKKLELFYGKYLK